MTRTDRQSEDLEDSLQDWGRNLSFPSTPPIEVFVRERLQESVGARTPRRSWPSTRLRLGGLLVAAACLALLVGSAIHYWPASEQKPSASVVLSKAAAVALSRDRIVEDTYRVVIGLSRSALIWAAACLGGNTTERHQGRGEAVREACGRAKNLRALVPLDANLDFTHSSQKDRPQ